jgi:hypothetical protein
MGKLPLQGGFARDLPDSPDSGNEEGCGRLGPAAPTRAAGKSAQARTNRGSNVVLRRFLA